MPDYLLTGRDPGGRKVTERVEADTPDEAVEALRVRGFDEVVLHTDDVAAEYADQAAVDEHISPADYIRLRDTSTALGRGLVVAGIIYRKSPWLTLAVAALLGYALWTDGSWGIWETILVVPLVLPLVLGLVSQLGGSSNEYSRMIEATAWARWQEVLDRAPGLEGKVPPEELAFRRAEALAGLGRLEEGLEVVAPFGDGEAMPEWLYVSRLEDVYRRAGRPAEALGAIERAAEMEPDNPTVLLSLAITVAWYERDARRAAELLEQARRHALSDQLVPAAECAEGLVRLRSGDGRGALDPLGRASRGFARMQHLSPLCGALVDKIHVAQALACAQAGDTEAGIRHFRAAKPRLEAFGRDDEIAECERALGLPAGG